MAAGSPLLPTLRRIAGRRNVIADTKRMKLFTVGFRTGEGEALAVVRPESLVVFWRVLQACTAHDAIVIVQAANTGLTGGSTPDGRYDRDVIVINTMHIKGIHLIDDGRQVVCLPGATLDELERRLAPLGREPHSVIGSSCIGASVMGGICNNSGGALVQRGPAYTELALYARLGADGALKLVNQLGIELGADPEQILARAERGDFAACDIGPSPAGAASDAGYQRHVRQVDEPSPARFNSDPRCLFEASGSAGKIALFAVRLDTFPAEREPRTFYIGTNEPAALSGLRRDLLQTSADLPISGEYIHRDAFDLADRYGKDTVLAIRWLGTARLPKLFALQTRVDRVARRLRVLPDPLGAFILQRAGRLFGDHLPRRMRAFRGRFEHHLVLKVAGHAAADVRGYLGGCFSDAGGDFFECTAQEAVAAFQHRFAVAGAAVRYRDVHSANVADIVALDVALRRNDPDWVEQLPPELAAQVAHTLYYGHFLCHVFHRDYILRPGADSAAFKHALLERLEASGARYPAEHNVGHLYRAAPELEAHYRSLDPCNAFNPGIGLTARGRMWA